MDKRTKGQREEGKRGKGRGERDTLRSRGAAGEREREKEKGERERGRGRKRNRDRAREGERERERGRKRGETEPTNTPKKLPKTCVQRHARNTRASGHAQKAKDREREGNGRTPHRKKRLFRVFVFGARDNVVQHNGPDDRRRDEEQDCR